MSLNHEKGMCSLLVDNRLLSKLRVAHAHDIRLVVCIWVALL